MRFHVKEAGADAKLTQPGPLGFAYHRRHPISTVPVARITAYAMVVMASLCFNSKILLFMASKETGGMFDWSFFDNSDQRPFL